MESEKSALSTSTADAVRTLVSGSAGSEVAEVVLEATRRVLRRRFRVALLIRDAYERMVTNAPVLEAVWTDLRTALRLLVAWTRRSYRDVSMASVALLIATLVYFVAPIDLIPDTLGAIGFTDDLALISTVVETVRGELQRFRSWEKTRSLSS